MLDFSDLFRQCQLKFYEIKWFLRSVKNTEIIHKLSISIRKILCHHSSYANKPIQNWRKYHKCIRRFSRIYHLETPKTSYLWPKIMQTINPSYIESVKYLEICDYTPHVKKNVWFAIINFTKLSTQTARIDYHPTGRKVKQNNRLLKIQNLWVNKFEMIELANLPQAGTDLNWPNF